MRTSTGVVATIVSLAVRLASGEASCGQAVCPIESTARLERPPAGGEILLDGSWEYIDQDQPRVGSHRAKVGERSSPGHDEVETINRRYRLLGEYGVTHRWTVGFLLPIVHNNHRHIDLDTHEEAGESRARSPQASGGTSDDGDDDHHGPGGEEEGGTLETWSFTGVGDVQVWARYLVIAPADPSGRSLSLGAGLKLPTGRTGVRNDDGELAEMTLQPGTGSVDPLLMASFVQPLNLRAADGRYVWMPVFGGLHVRIPGSDGRFGYRAGTDLVATVGTTYSLLPRVDLLGQINFRWRDRDDVGDAPGVPEENTGGESLFVSPGVRVGVMEGLAAYVFLPVPVYQRVNGIQLTAEWNLQVGVQYRFAVPWL